MRRLALFVGLCALIAQPSLLRAQSNGISYYQPGAPSPPGAPSAQRAPAPAIDSFTHERIFERAHRESVQRANRIESRKWLLQNRHNTGFPYSPGFPGYENLTWGPYFSYGAFWGYGWPLY